MVNQSASLNFADGNQNQENLTEGTIPNMSTTASESLRQKNRSFANFIVRFSWSLFTTLLALLVFSYFHPIKWSLEGLITIDQLSLVMSVAVTLFSSIVLSYSRRYLSGYSQLPRFLLNGLLFSFAVILMVIADHVAFFTIAWLSMGLLMARLIGGYTHDDEGRASERTARTYFLMSTFSLAAGFIVLGLATGSWHITQMVESATSQQSVALHAAGLLFITAAVIQSALFPFQRWIMSSMTAPTPASALMHAGFVNAGAVLLARVAPILYSTDLLWVLVLVGGIGAMIGKFSKFMQPNVKQKLACSTTAQMGFMLLECGLGFFAAAITHLILHGFYKAYLFLSAGENIEQKPVIPKDKKQWHPWQLPFMLFGGLAGGVIFAFTTGKGLHWDSGLFLNLIVVLTVVHGNHDMLQHVNLTPLVRLIALPSIIIPALLIYAVVFDAIDALLATVPMIEAPTPLTGVQIGIGVLYLATFAIIELELYKKFNRLYVYLLNLSQPKSDTILH